MDRCEKHGLFSVMCKECDYEQVYGDKGMGVKSTITLSRSEAETRWVNAKLEKRRKKLTIKAACKTNSELEDKLMKLDDEAHGGESFNNYLIQDEDEN